MTVLVKGDEKLLRECHRLKPLDAFRFNHPRKRVRWLAKELPRQARKRTRCVISFLVSYKEEVVRPIAEIQEFLDKPCLRVVFSGPLAELVVGK